MRYIFLIYFLLICAAISYFGVRGTTTMQPPIEIFPDMDRMEFVSPQSAHGFFADGQGARLPVDETLPMGYDIPETAAYEGGIVSRGFSTGDASYYNTGRFGDYWGTGMPDELGLDEETSAGFLRLGKERYQIYCGVCHGEAGDGTGVIGAVGFPAIANLLEDRFSPELYPDGRIYSVIVNGHGLMKPYADKLNVEERWAVVAYTRMLQQLDAGIDAGTPGIEEFLETPGDDSDDN